MTSLTIRSVSFSFDRSDKNIIHNLSASFNKGWTGLVGANGCGKSTLLKILAGKLFPNERIVQGKSTSYHCEQEIFAPPIDWNTFKSANDLEASRIKTSLALHDLLAREWSELSCGEQKRFQLGCALWNKPELLLIDEPTNHLDSKNRDYIAQALREFSGIGVIVSHDRELLEALCSKHLFFIGEKVFEISGRFSEAKTQLDKMFAARESDKANAKKKAQNLQKEAHRLEEINRAAKKRLSKSKIRPGDKDAKAKINLAKLTGKDASLGQKKQNIDNRVEKLNQTISSFDVVKNYAGSIAFDFPMQKTSKVVLFKGSGEIRLPSSKHLCFPELIIKTSEKIGVVGENGIGKTSLIEAIVNSGWLKTTHHFYLKQELGASEIIELRKSLKELIPEGYARCLQIIARLGSDAKQIFKSESWSAGEARKVAIALSIVNKVDLLVLDEPTNHLDLPSIENLERALHASPLTLLIISHDRSFINQVCTRLWKITATNEGCSILTEENIDPDGVNEARGRVRMQKESNHGSDRR